MRSSGYIQANSFCIGAINEIEYDMTTQEQLLDSLDSSRESLLMAIEPLPDEALVEKQALGKWSVSDTLINITAWEAELVTGLMRLRQNKRPDKLLEAFNDPPKFDSQRYVETQNRDLDQIFLDLQQVRVQVEEWILEFSQRELTNPRRYHWLKGRSIERIIAAATFEREMKFVPQLEAFAQQWDMQRVDISNGVVPLSTVNFNIQDNHNEDAN